jgi:hypothetical protein
MRTVKILGSRPPVVLSADLEARVLAVLRRMPAARRVVTRIDPALLMPVPRRD